jgi:hypothetical protein
LIQLDVFDCWRENHHSAAKAARAPRINHQIFRLVAAAGAAGTGAAVAGGSASRFD